jgi:gamma-glutamylcyclotransferase (GGCT)/AIG2-like uncharacterized protein YtfP
MEFWICYEGFSMRSETFLYFAYGSNMSTSRLRDRCDSSQAIGVAELKGYSLRWHKISKDGSGKCDIVKSQDPGETVWGVLYKIAVDQKADLDKAEGGYIGEIMEVRYDSEPMKVTTYRANENNIDHELKPYTSYCKWVICGAKEHALPENYIACLKAFAADNAISDPSQTELFAIKQAYPSC